MSPWVGRSILYLSEVGYQIYVLIDVDIIAFILFSYSVLLLAIPKSLCWVLQAQVCDIAHQFAFCHKFIKVFVGTASYDIGSHCAWH